MKLQIKTQNIYTIYHLVIPCLYLDRNFKQMSLDSNKGREVTAHAPPGYYIR